MTMKLMLGNCLEKMQGIEVGSVDLTVTSPPYDNLRTYNGNNNIWSEDSWKGVIQNLFRVTKDGGVVVWIVGDATFKGSETGTSFKQALFAKEVGFNLHDTMIYQKSNFSNPASTRYHQVFEYMFVWSKGKPKTFNPIKDRKNIYGGRSTYGRNTTTQPDGSKVEAPKKIYPEFGMRHNCWVASTTGQTGESKKYNHPAMFSVSLAEDHIKSWSNPGDTVFDPFLGSGTTGVAAKNLDRNFIGIELDETYFKIAEKRIAES
jgi:DNA modification methylase